MVVLAIGIADPPLSKTIEPPCSMMIVAEPTNRSDSSHNKSPPWPMLEATRCSNQSTKFKLSHLNYDPPTMIHPCFFDGNPFARLHQSPRA